MLRRISIRDMLLIDKIELEFNQGLNVLTGETGAGKSILLDCLGFVLGWRGRAELVRAGAHQGEVEAEFELAPDHPAFEILENAGIEKSDQLIIRRINSADGRKRAFINDRGVSGELLRELGVHLVELHGQHDDKGLLDDRSHLSYLDQYAKVDLQNMKSSYQNWQHAQKELESYKILQNELAKEAEFIEHAAAELGKLDAHAGEEAKLDGTRRLMRQGEKLSGELGEVLQLLSSDGLGTKLNEALKRVQNLGDKLDNPEFKAAELLVLAYDHVLEAETSLERLAGEMDFDAGELEATEERLFALRAAARKYGVSCDELPIKAEEFASQREQLVRGSGALSKLEQVCAQALSAAQSEAEMISSARKLAALALERDILAEFAPLKLENARFFCEFSQGALSAQGMDRMRFLVQTNPGTPAGNLSKIASGGELSRFLLALKICLHQDDSGVSMIFDEIDRGVGGQTADAVGRRLRKLSLKAQLLVVTHSPQVAALGHLHFRVSKTQSHNETSTHVQSLDLHARAAEIARMISGEDISLEAMAAAQKLLNAG